MALFLHSVDNKETTLIVGSDTHPYSKVLFKSYSIMHWTYRMFIAAIGYDQTYAYDHTMNDDIWIHKLLFMLGIMLHYLDPTILYSGLDSSGLNVNL